MQKCTIYICRNRNVWHFCFNFRWGNAMVQMLGDPVLEVGDKWYGIAGWHITPAPRELARVRGHQRTRWVGRDHYDRHLSPCPVIWLKAICANEGYLWYQRSSHTDHWPKLAVKQPLQQLQRQIQGSGFILSAGLTSRPPLKSSSRCLWETNEK